VKGVRDLWAVTISVGRHSTIAFTTYNVIATDVPSACAKAVSWGVKRGYKDVRVLECKHTGLVLP
jgi:hypothetical protein